jgi:acyl-CoA hydrolase
MIERPRRDFMNQITYTTYHLVKSEDLNHHGTLYAGRTAEWFVESGFIAAASLTRPENIVCLKIHGMTFTAPVQKGSLACFQSKVVFTGKTRIVANIKLSTQGNDVVRGFITFINVDAANQPLPHGVVVEPLTEEDKALYEEAKQLK